MLTQVDVWWGACLRRVLGSVPALVAVCCAALLLLWRTGRSCSCCGTACPTGLLALLQAQQLT